MSDRQLRLVPDRDSIAKTETFISDMLDEAEISMAVSAKINIAVDEIYSNVVNYSGAAHALVRCVITDREVSVSICDDGMPYNPLLEKDPDTTLSAGEREIGGLGIFMTKKLMDEISYSSSAEYSNELTMIKKLK